MSDALRPSSLFTAAASATAPSAVQGTLPNPPPEISQLPAGTTLRGTVLGSDHKGHLLVRTDLGTLAVSTKANLPPGSEVVLQIRSSGAQLHVLLMHSDAPAGGAAHRGTPPGPGPAGGPLPAPHGAAIPSPDQLTLGQTVRAVLQTPALAASTGLAGGATGGTVDPAIAAAIARLKPGSQIVLRILAVDAAAGAARGLAPTAPPTAPAPSVSPGALPGAGAHQGPIAPTPVPGQAGGLSAAVSQTIHPGPPGVATSQPGNSPGGAPGAVGPPSGAVPSVAVPPSQPGQVPPAGAGTPVPVPSAGTPTASAGAAAQLPVAPSAGAGVPGPSPRSLPTALPAGAGAAYGAAAQATPLAGPSPGAPGPGGAAPAPPPAAHLGPSPGPVASQLTGLVTATTNAGHPVLQTPVGTFTLEVQAPIPVGSRVVFELVPGALPRETAALPASLARAWPEIEEAVRLLGAAASSGASPALGGAAIPEPGARLASGLLFFLAALSGGDMSRWLGGQAVQTLKNAGRDNLLSRLGQDFGQLSRHVESGGADWRLFLIPLLDGSQVQQIRFFERHGAPGGGAGADDRDGEATRFILEVELSRLGDMQIDGLVRGRRFDLMLRTRRLLPDVMRHHITEIFSDANDAAGYVGGIGFQASRDWRFMPVDGGTAATGSGLVI